MVPSMHKKAWSQIPLLTLGKNAKKHEGCVSENSYLHHRTNDNHWYEELCSNYLKPMPTISTQTPQPNPVEKQNTWLENY